MRQVVAGMVLLDWAATMIRTSSMQAECRTRIPVRCKAYLLGCVQEPSFELHNPENFFALDIVRSAF